MADRTIPVDLWNPGQVFACLGFLEGAESLLGDAEGGFDWSDPTAPRFRLSAGGDAGSVGADAMSALVNLGYGRAEAHAAMQRARAAGAGDDLSALIAATLQELGK